MLETKLPVKSDGQLLSMRESAERGGPDRDSVLSLQARQTAGAPRLPAATGFKTWGLLLPARTPAVWLQQRQPLTGVGLARAPCIADMLEKVFGKLNSKCCPDNVVREVETGVSQVLMARGVWRATLPTAWWRGGHSTPCNMTDVEGRGAPGLDAVMVTEPGWMPPLASPWRPYVP